MKKQLLTLFLICSTLFLNAQTNLVPNGDMENWDSFDTNPNSWQRFFSGAWSKSADAQNGTASLELTIDSGKTLIYINTPNMAFVDGKTYVCTFYYKVALGTFSKVKFDLSHQPATFPENIDSQEFTDISATEWKKGTFEYTATTTENVKAFIYAYSSGGSKILVDNVSIVDKSTLATTNFVFNNNLKLFPNPATNSITVSGLIDSESYKVYNLLGAEIMKGNVSNNETISIQDLSTGFYLLNFDNGETIKFAKE